jgi:hypothetical protein
MKYKSKKNNQRSVYKRDIPPLPFNPGIYTTHDGDIIYIIHLEESFLVKELNTLHMTLLLNVLLMKICFFIIIAYENHHRKTHTILKSINTPLSCKILYALRHYHTEQLKNCMKFLNQITPNFC